MLLVNILNRYGFISNFLVGAEHRHSRTWDSVGSHSPSRGIFLKIIKFYINLSHGHWIFPQTPSVGFSSYGHVWPLQGTKPAPPFGYPSDHNCSVDIITGLLMGLTSQTRWPIYLNLKVRIRAQGKSGPIFPYRARPSDDPNHEPEHEILSGQ